MDQPQSGDDRPTYGEKFSPAAKALMKSLGGDPKSLTMTPEHVRKWGYDRPDSVLHLIPDPSFVELVIRIPLDLLNEQETDILAKAKVPPTRLDRRVRIAFWEEYEAALSNARPMDLELIARDSGAVSWRQFVEQALPDPYKLAWFMRPPAAYNLKMKEAHELGMDRLVEIMSLPVQDPATGKVNVGVGMLILNAMKMADQRLHGAVTQRMIQMNMKEQEVPKDSKGMDEAAVLAEMKRIETKLAAVRGAPRPALPEQPVSKMFPGEKRDSEEALMIEAEVVKDVQTTET